MGFMDKLKAAVQGRSKQIDAGVDRLDTIAKSHASDKYDGKLDTGAAKAKEAINKLDREN